MKKLCLINIVILMFLVVMTSVVKGAIVDDFETDNLWKGKTMKWDDGWVEGSNDVLRLSLNSESKYVKTGKNSLRIEYIPTGDIKDKLATLNKVSEVVMGENTSISFWIYVVDGNASLLVDLFDNISWRKCSSKEISLNFKGWKNIVLSKKDFSASHSWDKINVVQFSLSGKTLLYLDGISFSSGDSAGQSEKNSSYTIDTYFPMKLGNIWRYVNKLGKFETTNVVAKSTSNNDAEIYTVEVTSNLPYPANPEYYKMSSNCIERLWRPITGGNWDEPILKMPFKVGNIWNTENGRLKIVSVSEVVNTPAGNFKNCIKVEQNYKGDKSYYYYAPNVGFIKRSDGKGKSVVELKEYNISNE